jgi:hypothetical protein
MTENLPTGWKSRVSRSTGKTMYICQGEETPNKPTIPCDLPKGWEHKRSRSTGVTYYVCRAGNGGKGFSQWETPKEGEDCNESTKQKANSSNAHKGETLPAPEETDQEILNTGTAEVANSGSSGGSGTPALPAELTIQVKGANGIAHEYTVSQKGGKKRRRRRTKKNRNKRGKRKSRRV